MNKAIIILFLFLLTLIGCKKNPVSDDNDNNKNILQVDCVTGSPGCTELYINGDLPYTLPNGSESPFSGFADPCIRKDPSNNNLWLAYSWPNYSFVGNNPVPSVDIHLAKSIDGGTNWSFVKKLWLKNQISNPANSLQQGYLDHETANLIPVQENETVTWYAVRLNYFVPDQGGFSERPFDSFHITVMKAASPENLSNASSAIIGGTATNNAWNANKLIPPDLTNSVFFWNEPALYFENGKLYLVMVAFVYEGNFPAMSKNNIYVYSTTPTGNPESWTWSYVGKLTDSSIAAELNGERLTQVDIAKGKDGNLLALLTPDDWNTTYNDFNHKGCKVVELESIDPPKIKRGDDGKIVVRAIVTASDSGPLGSAASSYDPFSATGLLFTKRTKTQSELTAKIWSTSLKP